MLWKLSFYIHPCILSNLRKLKSSKSVIFRFTANNLENSGVGIISSLTVPIGEETFMLDRKRASSGLRPINFSCTKGLLIEPRDSLLGLLIFWFLIKAFHVQSFFLLVCLVRWTSCCNVNVVAITLIWIINEPSVEFNGLFCRISHIFS